MTEAARIWANARIASVAGPAEQGAAPVPGAIAARDGRICAVGPLDTFPPEVRADAEVIDCEGRLVTPGLIDCHTHLVYAGNRADEFERRLAGASYAEIAQAGGGIAATVRAVRAASEEELIAQSLVRLRRLAAEGVTTVEIKSGYGLETASEVRMLRAARRLGPLADVSVRTTFLGAHAVPPGADRRGYVAAVAGEMLCAVAAEGLADAVDAFCETVAFSAEEVATVFAAARAAGLPVKLHADQLTDGGGGGLAAAWRALSADHLEHASAASVQAMAAAGTVAVLLPGAFYALRESVPPPVALFRRYGVPMAIATDCNPGTSPLTSPLLAMNMAATLFGMTVAECLAGMTREAARALGLQDETGTIVAGKRADLAIWNAGRLAELIHELGAAPLHARVVGGRMLAAPAP
jgi:imidazolonepropionase